MEVTKVTVQKEEKQGSRVKGYAVIELDGVLKINGIRLIEGNTRLFAAMPNRKVGDDKYIDYVYPINKELREKIEKAIIEEYEKEN
ncbi:MAG TPA: SpoVG family protein [Candidatus Aphodocola excrementigallinarum]|uniref:SpoVG family protein n=1 Tax=Candidatus Aphodocola excrementigallinarum TaxID=2840670 RepID=A0A9D1LJ34_9FIRM|nr:SpoVG family protein [Candidatus Aphodocola excrementigallinarum]